MARTLQEDATLPTRPCLGALRYIPLNITVRQPSSGLPPHAVAPSVGNAPGMSNVGVVRQISGEWSDAQELVRLRIEADEHGQPHEVLISPPDMQSLIDLLLALSGDAGPRPRNDIARAARDVRTLPLDSVILGETDQNGVVLELNVGRIALAFFLPADACRNIGQTLTTLAATPGALSN